MLEIEVKTELALSAEQVQLIDLHSVLNILSVISNQLNILNLLAGKPSELKQSLAHIKKLKAWILQEPGVLLESGEINCIHQEILKAVSEVIRKYPDLEEDFEPELYCQNMVSLFKFIVARAEELQSRIERPLAWGELPVSEVRNKLIDVLEAIELNAHGRYHIVYSALEKRSEDYLIDIDVSSALDPKIKLPLVLLDIMRDLTANARKYTPPGGVVQTRLSYEGLDICLCVKDSGIGIPVDELAHIVHFGQRGSNVKDKPTMGGGFGLTKAWLFTQKLGGRMWIKSEVSKGTEIRILIPIHSESLT